VRLWDFAVAAWDRPGVSEICLRLQDRHGQCVPLLLWCAWVTAEGRDAGGDLARNAIALARIQEREMIAPLRDSRRALDIGGVAVGLRKAAKEAELAAERELLKALEALTPAGSAGRSESGDEVGQALADLIQAWNGCRARSTSRSLADRLR
jgi:uncharacterized protein (TIGR02444 family)